MDQAVLLGVTAALFYGVTDFVARSANRQTGVLRTMLWGQAFLAMLLSLAMLIQGKWPHAAVGQWLILAVSSLAIVAGTGCLYYGLAVGRITIVSPIMACYGAVSAVLAVMTGEALTWIAGGGLIMAVGGGIVSATSGKKTGSRQSGWLPASGAALLYGVGFWLQGRYSIPAFGPMTALWIYYLCATVTVAVTCVLRRAPVRLNGWKDTGLVLGTALLAGCGYAALVAGQATGDIAIVTALSAASTAITVVLAFMFLKEKPGLRGWLGVAAVAIGVAVLHLSSS